MPRYIVRNGRKPDQYDVIATGPHAVALGLKWIEAEALAKALNEEARSKHDHQG